MLNLEKLVRSLEASAADPSIDAVIFALPPGVLLLAATVLQAEDQSSFEEALEKQSQIVVETLTTFARQDASGKPLIIVLQPGVIRFFPGQRERLRKELLQAGIPTYMSLEHAANAMGKFLQYHRFNQQSAGDS